jgi:hypothetical protein
MSSLGYGQVWTDITASRALSTTYYNTTGKPISIQVVVFANNGETTTLTVNGLGIYVLNNYTGNDFQGTLTAIVTPSGSYSVASTAALNSWFELR